MSGIPILIVAGPTASGKSALAADIAETFAGVVINADSMQVYRELAIVTARPGDAETARAPHRLYGTLSVAEACSAGRWLSMATAEIESARTAGRIPVVVGGTGLYLKALTKGLSSIPDVPERFRTEAEALYETLGGGGFRERLRTTDRESAERLPDGDRQRLIRAWEVVTATGTPLPEWIRRRPPATAVDGPFFMIHVFPERKTLYATIDRRFAEMAEKGAIEEVAALLRSGISSDLPAMKAVGVRELAAYLREEISLSQAIASGQKSTRNYAKRQMTWLRHQTVPSFVVDAQYSESQREKIFNFIRHSVLTARI